MREIWTPELVVPTREWTSPESQRRFERYHHLGYTAAQFHVFENQKGLRQAEVAAKAALYDRNREADYNVIRDGALGVYTHEAEEASGYEGYLVYGAGPNIPSPVNLGGLGFNHYIDRVNDNLEISDARFRLARVGL